MSQISQRGGGDHVGMCSVDLKKGVFNIACFDFFLEICIFLKTGK